MWGGRGKEGGEKLDEAKINAKGKVETETKTKQTVQLRTSKIQTRRQAGGIYQVDHVPHGSWLYTLALLQWLWFRSMHFFQQVSKITIETTNTIS